jgi:hypothetical protein
VKCQHSSSDPGSLPRDNSRMGPSFPAWIPLVSCPHIAVVGPHAPRCWLPLTPKLPRRVQIGDPSRGDSEHHHGASSGWNTRVATIYSGHETLRGCPVILYRYCTVLYSTTVLYSILLYPTYKNAEKLKGKIKTGRRMSGAGA